MITAITTKIWDVFNWHTFKSTERADDIELGLQTEEFARLNST
jgi:hypothetical protein